MGKRLIAWLLLAALCLAGGCPALADEPRDITPLDYDSLPAVPQGQHHYLLTCIDNWESGQMGNTDGIVLVTLDTEAKRVIFFTLTREMLIKRPDGGIGRITYITKNFGPEALARIVSTHFGVKVEDYAVFCMNNIQDIIDAMGGVYITVTDAEADYLNRYRITRDSTKPSMDKAGTYLFGGHAAVIYMRIRKVGRDGDAGRTRRIRTVLTTLTEKYAQVSLGEAMGLLTKVSDSLVCTNMTMQDMLEAVSYAMELRGAPTEGYQMPPEEALEPIEFVGMQTRQVDFAYCQTYFQNILRRDEDEKTESR